MSVKQKGIDALKNLIEKEAKHKKKTSDNTSKSSGNAGTTDSTVAGLANSAAAGSVAGGASAAGGAAAASAGGSTAASASKIFGGSQSTSSSSTANSGTASASKTTPGAQSSGNNASQTSSTQSTSNNTTTSNAGTGNTASGSGNSSANASQTNSGTQGTNNNNQTASTQGNANNTAANNTGSGNAASGSAGNTGNAGGAGAAGQGGTANAAGSGGGATAASATNKTPGAQSASSSTVAGKTQGAASNAQNNANAAKGKAQGAAANAKGKADAAKGKAQGAASNAQNKANAAKDKAQGKVDAAKGKVQGAKDKVQGAKDKVQGAKDKVKGAKDKVNAVKDKAGKTKEGLQKASKWVNRAVTAAAVGATVGGAIYKGVKAYKEAKKRPYLTLEIDGWPQVDEEADKLQPQTMSLRSAMSAVYDDNTVTYTAATPPSKLKYAEIIGAPLVLTFTKDGDGGKNDQTSAFYGYVGGIECESAKPVEKKEDKKGRYEYTVVVVSKLWFLTRTSSSGLYQGETATDIIEAVLKGNNYKEDDYKFKLNGSKYPKIPLCTQYKETPYNLISRLAADFGLVFFEVHDPEKKKTVLTFVDNPNNYLPFPEGTDPLSRQTVTKFTHRYVATPTEVTTHSFDSENPDKNLQVTEPSGIELQHIKAPVYVPNCGYEEGQEGDGGKACGLMMKAFDVKSHKVTGGLKNCFTVMKVGQLINLDKKAFPDEKKPYVIVKITIGTHIGLLDTSECVATVSVVPANLVYYSLTGSKIGDFVDYEEDDSGDEEPDVSESSSKAEKETETEKQPAAVKPGRKGKRVKVTIPRIWGAQRAVVIGPEGKKVNTDEYGRVQIKFRWDINSKSNDSNSSWVPVSSMTGYFSVPRVGQSVFIGFINGDPDRPFVGGVFCDGDNKPPIDFSKYPMKSALVFGDQHSMVFNADPDSPSVECNHKGTYTETVEKGIKTSVTDGDLEANASNIKHTAEQGFSVEGETAEMKGKTTVDIEAGTAAKLKGNAGAELEGPGGAVKAN